MMENNDDDLVETNHRVGTIDRLQLAQTRCVATLDEDGIIHIINPDGQQLFALKNEHIPFELQPLLVTLNLWFVAWNGGRNQMQKELKDKVGELIKLCL